MVSMVWQNICSSLVFFLGQRHGDVSLSLIFLVLGPSRQLLPGPSFIPFCGDTFISGLPSATVMPSLCNNRNQCTIPFAILDWVGILGVSLRPLCLDIVSSPFFFTQSDSEYLCIVSGKRNRGSRRGNYSPSLSLRGSPQERGPAHLCSLTLVHLPRFPPFPLPTSPSGTHIKTNFF